MKTVYAYVCGDILHRGHVMHLNNAKKFGDLLIVGILTTKAIEEKKLPPILSFDERLFLVGQLKSVDIVIPQETYSPLSNIKLMRPDILIESESHGQEELAKIRAIVSEMGVKTIILPYYQEQSSTKIKENIRKKEYNEKENTMKKKTQ